MALPLTPDSFYTPQGKNPFEDPIKGAVILNETLEKVIATQKDLVKALSTTIQTSPKKTADDYKVYSENIGKAKQAINGLNEAEKAKKQIGDQLNKLNDDRLKGQLRFQQANAAQRRALREEIKLEKSAKDSVNALTIQLTKLKNEYRAGSAEIRRNLKPQIQGLDREVKKLNADIGNSQGNVGNYRGALKSLGASLGIVASGTLLVAQGFRKTIEVTKEAIEVNREFEKGITNVLTLLDEQQKEELRPILERGAIDIVANYGLQIEDVNNALFDAISNGIEAADAIQFLNKSAKLAVGGNAELTAVVKGSTKVYEVYKDEIESVDEIMNAFFAAQVKGATNVEFLANNIGKVASTAKKAGIPISELFGTFAGLTKFLDGTEESATALVNVINSLIKANPAAQKEFEKLGIETGITAIKQNGLLKTILQVTEATKDNEDAIVKLIPNIRAFKGIAGLTAESIAEIEKNITDLNDAEKSAILLQEAFNEQMETGQKQAETLGGTWNRLLVSIGGGESVFKKIGRGIREDLKKEINDLTKNIEILRVTWNRFFGTLTKAEYGKALVDIENRFRDVNDQIVINNEITREGNVLTKTQIKLINDYNNELETNLDFSQKSLEIAQEYYKTKEDTIEIEEIEIKTLATLRKELKDLTAEYNEINTADKDRLATKRVEIETLKELIKELENLGKAPKAVKVKIDIDTGKFDIDDKKLELVDDTEIDRIIDQYFAIEEISKRHYNSMLDIFANYATTKKAEDDNLSAAEIQKLDETNQAKAQATSDLVNTLVGFYNDLLNSRRQQLQDEINAQNQKINEQIQLIQIEQQKVNEGNAANVQAEKKKLDALQKERDKNLKEQAELQKKQERVDTATQISSLVTAIANIIKEFSDAGPLGVVLGLAAAAAAVAGFLSIKGDAKSATKLESGGALTEDGVYVEKGRRHSKGGNPVEAEKGEGHIIVSRGSTKKIGLKGLGEVSHMLESGSLDMIRANMTNISNPTLIVNNDYKEMLKEQQRTNEILTSQIHEKQIGNQKVFTDYKGRPFKIRV